MKATDVGHDTRASALREAKMLNNIKAVDRLEKKLGYKIGGKIATKGRKWKVMTRYIVYRSPA